MLHHKGSLASASCSSFASTVAACFFARVDQNDAVTAGWIAAWTAADEPAAEKREYIRYHRAHGLSIVEGCRLMGLSRSTYYGAPTAVARGSLGRRASVGATSVCGI